MKNRFSRPSARLCSACTTFTRQHTSASCLQFYHSLFHFSNLYEIFWWRTLVPMMFFACENWLSNESHKTHFIVCKNNVNEVPFFVSQLAKCFSFSQQLLKLSEMQSQNIWELCWTFFSHTLFSYFKLLYFALSHNVQFFQFLFS